MSNLLSQHVIALPEISNYSKGDYGAGSQNWAIEQDSNGIIYVANNEGLLSFDGTYWKNYPLPNKTIVRSLGIGSDNRIYVGGQDEIGFFSPDKNGTLTYHSLRNLLPEKNRTFADIWDVVRVGKDLFFRSHRYIFQYSDNIIKVYPAASSWVFLGLVEDKLIAQDRQNGLLIFSSGSWSRLIARDKLPPDFLATSITPFGGDSSLITTWTSELFILSGATLRKLDFSLPTSDAGQIISDAIRIDHENYALANNTNGCLIINRQGKIVQIFSRQTGLQNNSVISLFSDKNKNIWLGLGNGIDCIAYNNAVKHINPDIFGEASGHSAIVHQNQLYIGLSNGVFRLPLHEPGDLTFSQEQFEKIENTSGQVWGLYEINDHLLIGKHEGAFVLKASKAVLIEAGAGFWTFQPFSRIYPSNTIIAGRYNGISLFEFKNQQFISKGSLPNFSESARFLSVDNNETIWSSHPYRGVYKMEMKAGGDSAFHLYTAKQGLPSALNNHVYEIKNRIVVGTEKGIYEYDSRLDSFLPSAYFKPFFNNLSIRYLREDSSGNIWFIHEKNVGVVDLTGPKPQVIYMPELNGKMVSGFEHIFPLNNKNVLIGAEKGFYHINYEKYKLNNHQLNVQIRSVKASGKNDSILFGGYFGEINEVAGQSQKDIPEIEYKLNSIHFEFSSTLFEQQSNLQYTYYLEGFDKSWSEWSKKTEKDYTNLPAGSYSFYVKARNNLGNESKSTSYSFIIIPPWYRSPIAYFIYFLLVVLAIFTLYKLQHRRLLSQQQQHLEEQRRLQYLHQLELEKTEKEIIQLKNEKLESEIEFKNSELASTAMHLVQKGELHTKIKSELLRLNKSSHNKEVIEDIKKIIRILGEEERMDEDWQQFAVHFDKVHSDFLVALKEIYPNLSSNELKLCAYLRMNLSSKEIAQLLNISLRGIEISRYRLRKKLQIPTETNLFQFLLNFHSEKKENGVGEPRS